MTRNTLRANIAKIVYDAWSDQGHPQVIAAHNVLERYRREIGDISAELLEGELYYMVDDPGPLPFLRVRIGDRGGELGYLGLTNINAENLLIIMGQGKS